MKELIQKGKTSVIIRVSFKDSSSTTGGFKTGITAAKLTCSYSRDDDGNAGANTVSLSTGTRGTWSSGGVILKDDTNAPGEIEFGVPNAALVSGSRTVTFTFQDAGSNNIAPTKVEIQLTGPDIDSGTNFGLSALPTASAGASNGVMVNGTNAGAVTWTGGWSVQNGVTFGNNNGDAFVCSSTGGSGYGINANGNGASAGIKGQGGVTGPGMSLVGGGTSGAGLSMSNTSGDTWTVSGNSTLASMAVTGALTTTGTQVARTSDLATDYQQRGVAVTLPSSPPNNFITAASITAGALNGKGDWLTTSSTINVTQWAGQAVAVDANNLPKVDVEAWKGGLVPATLQVGIPKVDISHILGTASPATAGFVGIDWGHLAGASSTQNLSATTIGTLNALANNTITAASIAAAALNGKGDWNTIAPPSVASIWAQGLTEPTGVPTWSGSSILQLLEWMAAFTVNKVLTTVSQQTLRNNADSTNVSTSALSDDGVTNTRGKFQ